MSGSVDVPIPLLSGAYNSPAYIAGAQRCVNLYPEVNPATLQSRESLFTPSIPFTHRLTPGLTQKFQFPDATMVRGLFRATNGDLYGVCGQSVYYVAPDWSLTRLGYIIPGNTPVKFKDNGISAVLVDGTSTGYQINLSTRTMTGISPSNAAGSNGYGFKGANWIDELDGFLVGNQPGTPNWFSSGDFAVTFDSLAIAQKSGKPDPIQILAVLHRYVWLVGTQATEIWYNAGGVNFPFALVTGPYIEHGAVAQYSGAVLDESLFWIHSDSRGQGVALEGQGSSFTTTRASTHAIEQEWAGYSTITDAIGMAYQQGGHSFYVVRFPTADKTWAYDRMTQQWHEKSSFDASMNEHQWRVTCTVNAYNQVLGGDYSNGRVYALDVGNFTDNGVPIQRRRGFPHINNQMHRTKSSQFVLDIECGNSTQEFAGPVNLLIDPDPTIVPLVTDGPFAFPILLDPLTTRYDFGAPQCYLRWSDTRGKSWGNPVPRSIGQPGAYNATPSWRRLGLGRDRVYEIYWSAPEVTAFNGAFVSLAAGRT